jgi:formylglycine-generating enzyme required for sulfatase activity
LSRRKDDESAQDPGALRQELARVREEARQALSQLRGELDAVRESQDAMRDVDSVTDQIALRQELDTMRSVLHEKERQVDTTAAQCRRLEDELEDQHLAYDGLKHDLERKKLSLAAAREQVWRVSQERHEIEGRYQTLLSSGQPLTTRDSTSARPPAGRRAHGLRFLGGLVAGIVIAAVAVTLWKQLDPLSEKGPQVSDPQSAGIRGAASPEAEPESEPAPQEAGRGQVHGEAESGPVALGTVRDPLRNGSTGPRMLAIKGSDFTMGKRRSLPEDDEGPAHGVRLNGFLIGATEVTFEEYDLFVRATGRRFPDDFGWGRGRRPVVDVSWVDASAYTEWLSLQTGKRYRLPSEAEWEYAAGGGRRSSYWWGYRLKPGRAVCFDCGTIWDNRSSAPVGTYDPNPLGLYDTAGNVLEWVEDCYRPNYTGAPVNGQPWGGSQCLFRVARGGAFNKPARSMRTTARHRFAPETRINFIGFRLARDE